MAEPLIDNNVREERLAAGIDTVEELAQRAGIDPTWCSYIEEGRVLPTAEEYRRLLTALGDIPANRLYMRNWRQFTKVDGLADGTMTEMSKLWRSWRDQGRVLMSREEINYFEQSPGPDHHTDVYVNLSCGTQRSPKLILDTVSVLEALGVNFIAAAGPGAGCCGKPIELHAPDGMFERFRDDRNQRSKAWGATTHVNWCGACQQTAAVKANLHELADGTVHHARELQLIPFLEEQVRELGDRVPWKKTVPRRVLAEGHAASTSVHRGSQRAIPPLLARVPGVEVVDLYDGWHSSDLSPCAAFGREGPMPEWTKRPETPEEFVEHRARLTADIRARGADTVSCMHQGCHQAWSYHISDELAVVHPVSVLAEALDCAHPDRFQEAIRLGDPQKLLEESRPRWQSWGMSERRAAEMAGEILDAGLAVAVSITSGDRASESGPSCTGGCGGCQVHATPA